MSSTEFKIGFSIVDWIGSFFTPNTESTCWKCWVALPQDQRKHNELQRKYKIEFVSTKHEDCIDTTNEWIQTKQKEIEERYKGLESYWISTSSGQNPGQFIFTYKACVNCMNADIKKHPWNLCAGECRVIV